MNQNPRFIEYIDREKTEHIKALMLELNIETVPVLDNNHVVVGIITWIDLFSSQKQWRINRNPILFSYLRAELAPG